jgi:hypothetical protein
MEDKVLEFEISGCIYTGYKEVTLDNLTNEFIEFCESKGWEFCGITKPLE